jgi:acetolactate synthase I/II/III large subunit
MIADEIARWLEEKSITHSFGIIGGGNVVLWDAIHRRGYTKLICVHHEQAAVMAAAYFYRISGALSVALCTTGAGSTNAITGVMAAYMDRIPVMVISGNEASKYMDKPIRVWGVQGYDSSRVAEKFCKNTDRIHPDDDWRFKLEFSLQEALDAPQGPVWIDIPKDVQGA